MSKNMLSPEAAGFSRRFSNKNLHPGKRNIKGKLTTTNSFGKESTKSSENSIKDFDSTVMLVQFPEKRYNRKYITWVIKTLLALFPDCPMYFRNDKNLEVFLLPEVPTHVKAMRYRGVFKEQMFYEGIHSSEFIVWGCNEETFSIAIKSDDEDHFFNLLLEKIIGSSYRKVQYQKLVKSFVKKLTNAPIISLKIDTVCPLGKYSYALSSTLKVPREILLNQNAALVPSCADFTSSKHGTICTHATSVYNVAGAEQTSFSFHNPSQQTLAKLVTSGSNYMLSSSEAAVEGCNSSNDVMTPGASSSETTATNNISSFASAKDVVSTATQDAIPVKPEASTVRHRNPARYPRYITESSRHKSYSTWPHEKPMAEECAIAGFFYTGDYDLIRCFQCGIGLKDFSPEDDPMAEHIRNSETCLYLVAMFGPEGLKTQRKELDRSNPENNRRRQYNEFKGNRGDTSSNHTPSSPQYSTFESRLLTFESDNFRSTQIPGKVAAAGLFYTGVGDEVRCFFCNGGLRHWEENDDPWTEHSKWYPACGFVREVKGDAFVEKIQQRANTPATMLNVPTNPSAAVNYQNDLGLDLDLVTMKTICMEEMGFTEETFDEAVYHLKLDGYYHPNIEDIINRIDQIQKETNNTASQHISETFYEENQRLKRMVKCSKCKANDTNALFLPCAHHVMCIDCARDVKRCPLCNRVVNDAVRTFMG